MPTLAAATAAGAQPAVLAAPAPSPKCWRSHGKYALRKGPEPCAAGLRGTSGFVSVGLSLAELKPDGSRPFAVERLRVSERGIIVVRAAFSSSWSATAG